MAFAGALVAWQSRQARWWVLAAAGAMVTMQCHVLGAVAAPPLLAGFLADLRRRRAAGDDLGPVLRAGLAGAAIIVLSYVPLAVNELTHDFAETRAILAYLTGAGASPSDTGILTRIVMVGLRSITWPFVGLISDRVALSIIAAAIWAALAGLAVLLGRRSDQVGARWLMASIGWSVLALAVFAPSLAVITPGLPNDHYHAFLDPLVLALAGAGLARLAAVGLAPLAAVGVAHGPGRMAPLAGALGGLLVAMGVVAWPPAVAPDGGWALADRAAARVVGDVGDRPFALDGIPPFKSADALRFPLQHRGAIPLDAAVVADDGGKVAAVLVCDPLFSDAVGATCGGPAEAAWQTTVAAGLTLADRFEAGPRRVISVYLGAPPPAATVAR